MPFRATCDSVDILNLFLICLSQCQDEQRALSDGTPYYTRLGSFKGSAVKHHDDIFEIEVCYNTDAKEVLIKLGCLNIYIDEADGEYYP